VVSLSSRLEKLLGRANVAFVVLNIYTLLTTPNELAKPIHDRMPVILRQDVALWWLTYIPEAVPQPRPIKVVSCRRNGSLRSLGTAQQRQSRPTRLHQVGIAPCHLEGDFFPWVLSTRDGACAQT
jgi:hypothetical protein